MNERINCAFKTEDDHESLEINLIVVLFLKRMFLFVMWPSLIHAAVRLYLPGLVDVRENKKYSITSESPNTKWPISDSWPKCQCLMSIHCVRAAGRPCPPPPPPPGPLARLFLLRQHVFCQQFPTLIFAIWPSSYEVCLGWWLKVMGWISEPDISLSSDITGGTFQRRQSRCCALHRPAFLLPDPEGGLGTFSENALFLSFD